jgi:hypothetical protein
MGASLEDDDDHHEQPKQPHLATQDASAVDPAKLTALTPEVVRIKGKNALPGGVVVVRTFPLTNIHDSSMYSTDFPSSHH